MRSQGHAEKSPRWTRATACDAPGRPEPAHALDRSAFPHLLSSILARLEADAPPVPIVLSGGIGSGKTRTAEALAQELGAQGVSVGGVVAPRVLSNGETIGYRVRDLLTREERVFARQAPPGIQVGRFSMDEDGLRFALLAIERGAKEARVVVVDEVGRWELAGGGLAPAVRILLASPVVPVLLVRDSLLDSVLQGFAVSRPEVFPIAGPEVGK